MIGSACSCSERSPQRCGDVCAEVVLRDTEVLRHFGQRRLSEKAGELQQVQTELLRNGEQHRLAVEELSPRESVLTTADRESSAQRARGCDVRHVLGLCALTTLWLSS